MSHNTYPQHVGIAHNVDFELGEDVRNEARLVQDEAWSSVIANARSNFSSRETCLMYAPNLKASIKQYHLIRNLRKALLQNSSPLSILTHDLLVVIVEFALSDQFPLIVAIDHRECNIRDIRINREKYQDLRFQIFARKRPLLEFETKSELYDCIHVPSDDFTQITLHDGKISRNNRRLTMTHKNYMVDRVFNEHTSNEKLCAEVLQPLVNFVCGSELMTQDTKKATLICYGQTGTGKTYTLLGAIDYLSICLVGKHIEVCPLTIKIQFKFMRLSEFPCSSLPLQIPLYCCIRITDSLLSHVYPSLTSDSLHAKKSHITPHPMEIQSHASSFFHATVRLL